MNTKCVSIIRDLKHTALLNGMALKESSICALEKSHKLRDGYRVRQDLSVIAKIFVGEIHRCPQRLEIPREIPTISHARES